MLSGQLRRDESGIGLILVIGISVVVFGLIATALNLATNALRESTVRTNFELALAVAEDGIDTTLAKVQLSYNKNAGESYVGTAECENTSAVSGDEGKWANDELDRLSKNDECIVRTDSGRYVAFNYVPFNSTSELASNKFGRVYSKGWHPDIEDPRAISRTVKVEYGFLPDQSQFAILTDGNLELNGSATVSTVNATDAVLAAVHTNGMLLPDTGGGNPTVTGLVSSSELSSKVSNRFDENMKLEPKGVGRVTKKPTVSIPKVSAMSYYKRVPEMNASREDWYDLCPDNEVRHYSENGKPCEGDPWGFVPSVEQTDPAMNTWEIQKDAPAGIYYVHEGNAKSGTGTQIVSRMTVIASAKITDPADPCGKQYGNIDWQRYSILQPAAPNLFFLADSDLDAHAQYIAGGSGRTKPSPGVVIDPKPGSFVAGDQVKIDTSGQFLVGSVIAADQCPIGDPVAVSSVSNVTIDFAPDATSPFASIINKMFWIEL